MEAHGCPTDREKAFHSLLIELKKLPSIRLTTLVLNFFAYFFFLHFPLKKFKSTFIVVTFFSVQTEKFPTKFFTKQSLHSYKKKANLITKERLRICIEKKGIRLNVFSCSVEGECRFTVGECISGEGEGAQVRVL